MLYSNRMTHHFIKKSTKPFTNYLKIYINIMPISTKKPSQYATLVSTLIEK